MRWVKLSLFSTSLFASALFAAAPAETGAFHPNPLVDAAKIMNSVCAKQSTCNRAVVKQNVGICWQMVANKGLPKKKITPAFYQQFLGKVQACAMAHKDKAIPLSAGFFSKSVCDSLMLIFSQPVYKQQGVVVKPKVCIAKVTAAFNACKQYKEQPDKVKACVSSGIQPYLETIRQQIKK